MKYQIHDFGSLLFRSVWQKRETESDATNDTFRNEWRKSYVRKLEQYLHRVCIYSNLSHSLRAAFSFKSNCVIPE